MSSLSLGNLIINGVGTSNGGIFDSALISGRGTVNGALDCKYLKCNGTGTVNGDVKSDKTKISGSAKIFGNVACEDLFIEGKAVISGDTKVNKLIVRGKGYFEGHVKGENLKVRGSFFVGGDCEAETFHSEGNFNVGGLLSAEKVEIHIGGECRAVEIGGERIRVKQKPNFLRDLFKVVFPIRLETDVIEGDHIELENTKAKVVRGNHIIIGENCEIDLVEFKETFRVEKNGKVKEHHQI